MSENAGMDMKTYRIAIIVPVFIGFFMLYTVSDVVALNLRVGSDVDRKTIVLSPGETRAFMFSFLNAGDVPVTVKIDADSISPLDVNIVPGIIEMPAAKTGIPRILPDEWYLLDDGITHVPVYKSLVYVQAPYTLYSSEIHDYVLNVHVSAGVDDKEYRSSIRETIMQVHEYQLKIHLSDSFISHIKSLDESINLDFRKSINPMTYAGKSKAHDKEDDDTVIYVNSTQMDTVKPQMIDINRISDHAGAVNTDDNSAEDSTATIIIMLLCLTALLISIRI